MAPWEGKLPGLVHVVDDDASVRIAIERRLKPAGYEVATKIYITGKDNPRTRSAAIESGCIAYPTKPFVAKSLIEPIERASAEAA
jgi:FixJ family two-component response regulator